jgi:hypothetical protein
MTKLISVVLLPYQPRQAKGMSDSDDEHGRIAFSHDRDYEGGEWIDGEFYARRQRHGRTLTKEEQLYG